MVNIGLALLALATGLAVFYAMSQDNSGRQEALAARAEAPAPSPSPAKKPRTVALWIGDSYPENSNAGGHGYAYPRLASIKMGWTEGVDAQGGTGFINDGKTNSPSNVPVPERLDRFTGNPRYVIVDAGRNDAKADFATETAPAVRSYLDALKAKWPEAKLILVVPYFMTSEKPNTAFAELYAEEAVRLGGVVIDPLVEGWLRKDVSGMMVANDKVHPNQDGQRYIAEHLAERFKALGITPAA
ncbi:SGNH/GDSL hydrolase family protein [Pseudarthrobacter oxydans]|uniref:SGNH/GDSL hydrolase family protein n=1 Tax=Pseudarthrobacter oxydans TaxID=1671 RepID=UPI00341B6A49